MPKIAVVHFENGSTNTICFPVKDETEAREIALSGLESSTGLPRNKLVRITKVEWVDATINNNLMTIWRPDAKIH